MAPTGAAEAVEMARVVPIATKCTRMKVPSAAQYQKGAVLVLHNAVGRAPWQDMPHANEVIHCRHSTHGTIEMDNTDSYEHLVCYNTASLFVEIHRIQADGLKILYTEISFDEATKHPFEKFARLLGENIIIDSTVGRDLFP
jgi:hypothetical protein